VAALMELTNEICASDGSLKSDLIGANRFAMKEAM
jgi:hypothetical protein